MPPAYWLAPVVNLCVSDANKNLLVRLCVAAPAPPGASASTVTCGLDANPGSQVRSAWLLPLLLDTLLLDPGHVRAGLADGVKTAIQADAADCLMQIALFEPGRALLKADRSRSAMDALRALAAGQARADRVQRSASGRARPAPVNWFNPPVIRRLLPPKSLGDD